LDDDIHAITIDVPDYDEQGFVAMGMGAYSRLLIER
jgi:hypothetical protein